MLFYIFLPILIFESAYNFKYKNLFKSAYSIFSLSIIWVLLSAITISSILYYSLPFFGFEIPYLVCLLYWSLISATDTVAVLSLFKSIWAPKRLITIFEWESLFNDWTSIAIFLVILWIIETWNSIEFSSISNWVLSFSSMFFGWIIFGWIAWVIFSKVIQKIKNNEVVEVTLTMVLAHLTFILSEVIWEYVFIWDFNLEISWVIATTVAALVMWNYWRYKITPKVSEYMEKFWSFFAFVANALVFILLWIIISDIQIDFFSWAIFIVIMWIVAWMVARAVSVFIPIWIVNKLNLERQIPFNWQKILAWWSPRWALSIMMLFMIPSDLEIPWWNLDFSIKDFLILITISTIMFTLFVKVPTVWVLIKKLKLNKLNSLEKLEKEQSTIMIFQKNLETLDKSLHKTSITKSRYKEIKDNFDRLINKSIQNIKVLSEENKNLIDRMASIYSLWMQKIFLIELLTYNEIDEKNFKYLLNRIEDKWDRLEYWIINIIILDDDYKENFLERFHNIFVKSRENDFFIRNRSQKIIIWKVIKELKEIKKIDFGFEQKHFDKVIEIYEEFYELLPKINIKNEKIVKLEDMLYEKWIAKISENTINELKTKWLLTNKLYDVLIERVDEILYR